MSDSPSCSRRLGFIHIPKNAGTSVIKAIVDNGLPIHVSRHEYPGKVADDFRALLRVEGLDDSAVLPRVNGSDSCEERLSLEAQAFLERIYAADFQVVGIRGMAA